LPGWWNW